MCQPPWQCPGTAFALSTKGVIPPAVAFQAPKIELSRQDVPVPQPPRPPVLPDAERTASSRLRGTGVLLWRQAEMVASEPPK
jgi:hypothetical protein